MTLWRLDGPLASLTRVTGLYPDDTWSGPERHVAAAPLHRRRAEVRMHSRPDALRRPPDARAGTRRRATRRPDRGSAGRIGDAARAAHARADGTCTVRFSITPTAVPADVMPGSTDDRVLGVHFDAFVYDEPA